MIPISNIVSIHTSIKTYQRVKKNFTLHKNMNNDCFIGIEAKKGEVLELLASDE
jgi:hypothetical protein